MLSADAGQHACHLEGGPDEGVHDIVSGGHAVMLVRHGWQYQPCRSEEGRHRRRGKRAIPRQVIDGYDIDRAASVDMVCITNHYEGSW
ncbi:hypothetical protein GCM10010412_064710 [Nonomuraea recticatena]|uniref:Uncharacterized protein n=1 Tax=Nonomuraea recticatena TaxID=46178 RepID=A0ABN3SNR4_9ACTN